MLCILHKRNICKTRITTFIHWKGSIATNLFFAHLFRHDNNASVPFHSSSKCKTNTCIKTQTITNNNIHKGWFTTAMQIKTQLPLQPPYPPISNGPFLNLIYIKQIHLELDWPTAMHTPPSNPFCHVFNQNLLDWKSRILRNNLSRTGDKNINFFCH